ncbi:MAG: hypothetical protein WA847_01435 [Terriglobales bacterium]
MQSGRLPARLGQPLNLLGINQSAVSKMERRPDMYISTLQSMIRAMGGQLKIEAVFPEGKVEISSASSRKPPGRIEWATQPWKRSCMKLGRKLGLAHLHGFLKVRRRSQ